jgi:hypothetical protein
MSGTKRTPIARQANLQVTPHALALFAATEKASRQRRAASCVANLYGYCSMECGACQDWANAHSEIHSELALRPWQWPALPICPHPPGSPAARAWRASGPELALQLALEQARRDAA